MSAVVDYQVKDNIAVITVNNPPVNALSQAARQGLVESIERLNSDAQAKAGIITCAGRTFIAGADISEFNKPPLDPVLPEVINIIESSTKLIVAAIHGTALGGGFETAMACHYRCALVDAKVGLPEVKLGLLPGASGTQRLPRLIGVGPAIEWMVSGEMVAARRAFELGAIDRLLTGELLDGAIDYVKELLEKGANPVRLSAIALSQNDDNRQIIKQSRDQVNRQWRGFFSPQKIIDCVESGLSLAYDEAVRFERELFNECKVSPHSRALRRLFFAERQVGKVSGISRDIPVRNIQSVAVVGAGTMGSTITVCFLNAGIPVYLTDGDEAALDAGVNRIKQIFQSDLDRRRLSPEDLNDRLALLSTTLEMAHLVEVDLVIESVVEDLNIKQALFKQLSSLVKPDTIVASNTSTLDINTLAKESNHDENVIGMHFFVPAHKMKLLEIVRGEKTADDVLATVMKLAKRLNKTGVVVNSGFGFVGNRIFLPYLREAQLMLLQGIPVERVDQVAYDWGFAMGPFEVMDLSGLDVFHSIYQQLGESPGKYAYYPLSEYLFKKGRLGKKNATGFYRYHDKDKLPDPEVMSLARQTAEDHAIPPCQISDEEIINRLVLAMVNEAGYILQENIAACAGDIDVIMVNGYGFPRYQGGPMCYA
ncbi:MAG: 3-hydroxyacyl-CoA dehydrogenase, partial [Gammaproteobacteria bacterium]|nr:3-hydroxyacyl-CoA dehydrogenase [Gammaproteobacteria bacterium]